MRSLDAAPPPLPRRSLLRRYATTLLSAVCVPLAGYAVSVVWVTAAEQHDALAEVQSLQAMAAAQRISQFVREIEGQLRWTTHLEWSGDDDESHRVDALRLLRQAPSVTDVALLDGSGRERLFVSRISMDRRATGADRSSEPAFRTARERGAYYGPVHFRRDTEPYLTIALAGPRPEAGVVVADINLKYARDVVADVRVGREGRAYVVDRDGRLIAHPDASLVLRRTDLSALLQRFDAAPGEPLHRATGAAGQRAVVAQAREPLLDWRVLVELPEHEADAPRRRALARLLWIAAASLAAALAFALALSYRMIRPIRALTDGAARIGAGRLDQRIAIGTRDELQQLGDQFNAMADELQRTYAGLELKVAERTRALTAANQAKSRFVAAASHDLRQPLHALNLLVAQLRQESDLRERDRLARQIENAVASINGLFADLLDISKLDAGAVAPQPTDFGVQQVFDRIEAGFATDARAQGLRLRVRSSRARVRSDPVLLERIVANLVGNALHYTQHGGVLVACRRHGAQWWIQVWDTGIGIPADRHERIFDEFYQVAPTGHLRGEGLGLGLAIVARLALLLGHTVGLRSVPGRGSCFTVTLPAGAAGVDPPTDGAGADRDGTAGAGAAIPPEPLRGRHVFVIDNDPDVRAVTAGLLGQWGVSVTLAGSTAEASDALASAATAPDLLLVDLHLGDGTDGLQAIATLRAQAGLDLPAVVVSGDVSAAARERVAGAGLPLAEKPVPPMKLRALLTRAVAQR
jgi:signal transduction histidine kinase